MIFDFIPRAVEEAVEFRVRIGDVAHLFVKQPSAIGFQ